MVVSRFIRRKRKPQIGPYLPQGVRIYAVGDVHGRLDLLDEILAKIARHHIDHPIARPVQVFLGDYIDRGPQSAQVIDRLVEWSKTSETIYLKGNHEEVLTEFLTHPPSLRDWSAIGGLDTLRSYGLKPALNPEATAQKALASALQIMMPASHRLFWSGLQTSFTCGGFFFVHAGIRPGVPLQAQKEQDLLWIRDEFLFYEQPFEKIVVHGHTPVREIDIRPNRINIDTGAYATGNLSCLIIEAGRIEQL